MADPPRPRRVLLTGATGFVGGYVLKKLVTSSDVPVCLVRDPEKLARKTAHFPGAQVISITGNLFSTAALRKAAAQSDVAIHLVGIILQRGQDTFARVHYEGTRNVLTACQEAGIKRYVHMSALGARPNAVSRYHQTKHEAEELVRKSGLDWTIFRPSLIHGPDGEFMELMKTFACGLVPPVMPYFGRGENRLQPVDVRDVAECFVRALDRPQTIHRAYGLGGPRSYSWKELYRICQKHIPGARRWKPQVGQPVALAKLLARTVMKLPAPTAALDRLKFDVGQVQMSQEDCVCDVAPAERELDLTFRDFETELAQYGGQIR